MDFEFRPVDDRDKEYLRSLHKRCYFGVVSRQFGSWDDAVQAQFFEDEWHPKKMHLLQSNDQLLGMVCWQINDDHIFLDEIQIEPEFQRRGIGTKVISDLASEAHDLRIPLKLKVLKQNNALPLYLGLGFVETGRTETHIELAKAP